MSTIETIILPMAFQTQAAMRALVKKGIISKDDVETELEIFKDDMGQSPEIKSMINTALVGLEKW